MLTLRSVSAKYFKLIMFAVLASSCSTEDGGASVGGDADMDPVTRRPPPAMTMGGDAGTQADMLPPADSTGMLDSMAPRAEVPGDVAPACRPTCPEVACGAKDWCGGTCPRSGMCMAILRFDVVRGSDGKFMVFWETTSPFVRLGTGMAPCTGTCGYPGGTYERGQWDRFDKNTVYYLEALAADKTTVVGRAQVVAKVN